MRQGNNKKPAPKYPVREWYGKYTKWVAILKGRATGVIYDRTLERFFGMFPKYRGLEEFTSVDVADYRLVRLRDGCKESTVEKEISYIHLMWQWLVQDMGLPLHSIVRAFKNRTPYKRANCKAKGKLTLEQATRILEECTDLRGKRHILHVIKGGGCYIRPRDIITEIYNAADRVGVIGFRMTQLKMRATNRLAIDIIKAYCDKILDSLPPEPQFTRHTLTAVEGSSFDEGTTVLDGDNDLVPVSGISQEQLSSEG